MHSMTWWQLHMLILLSKGLPPRGAFNEFLLFQSSSPVESMTHSCGWLCVLCMAYDTRTCHHTYLDCQVQHIGQSAHLSILLSRRCLPCRLYPCCWQQEQMYASAMTLATPPFKWLAASRQKAYLREWQMEALTCGAGYSMK